jgi:hypothetical protein
MRVCCCGCVTVTDSELVVQFVRVRPLDYDLVLTHPHEHLVADVHAGYGEFVFV